MKIRQKRLLDIFSNFSSVFLVVSAILFLLSGCAKRDHQISNQILDEDMSGQIFLYGEHHSVERILEEELQLWHTYYHEQGMRHLFVELPYYTAEFLNIWMQSDSDDILDQLYDDLQGTAGGTQETKVFYQRIKEEYPETIFHGTDVGHQYHTTGARYLTYLESVGQKDSEAYILTQEAIKQGKYYYRNTDNDYAYRENMMVENFIREFDKLGSENIMGIYGAVHTYPDYFDPTGTVSCMAAQLAEYYGAVLHTEDLSLLRQPIRVDTIEVGGKTYEASYFGEMDLTSFSAEYLFREYWRLENAYDDFKDCPITGNVLPYDNYPMAIEAGQVFVIDFTKTDGSVERVYFRSDGNTWNNLPSTGEFAIPFS